MTSAPSLQWDLFCQVIDNYGDIGVCWRLASQLAARGHRVRLWVDDASALSWMAPQGAPGVELRDWHAAPPSPPQAATDVLVEAFGCEIPPAFLAACAQDARQRNRRPVWINLEYLSAESYVERMHRLPSPVQHGPAAGWTRWFFYPGFTPATGGLLLEPGLLQRQHDFMAQRQTAWREDRMPDHGAARDQALWISLFSYEPPALPTLLQLASKRPTHLLVTPGRSTQAVQAAENRLKPPGFDAPGGLQPLSVKHKLLSISYLHATPQSGFDELLWACDLNAVRGEDSLVRALWAGKPLLWNIYPQHDDAHHEKLAAFLDWLDAPATLRQLHDAWNGTTSMSPQAVAQAVSNALNPSALAHWGECVLAARARLLAQDDLVTQLLGFITEKQ